MKVSSKTDKGRDENVVAKSKRILGMASMYVMLEHWVQTPSSPEAYRLMQAYRMITSGEPSEDKRSAVEQPKSPTVA